MGHGGRANFTGFQALLEITQAHITPNIARQINQDGVGARNGVKQLGHVIMRFNLNAVGLKRQTQAPVFCGCTCLCMLWHFNDRFGKGLPIKLGPSRKVCVVIANSAIHFGLEWHSRNFLARVAQSDHHIGKLLANRCGARGLTMRSAQHGHRRIGVRHASQLID